MKTFIQYLIERGMKQTLRGNNPQQLKNQIIKQQMRVASKMKAGRVLAGFPEYAATQGLNPRGAEQIVEPALRKIKKRIDKGHAPNIDKLTTALAKHPGKHGDEARDVLNTHRALVKAHRKEKFMRKQEFFGGAERN